MAEKIIIALAVLTICGIAHISAAPSTTSSDKPTASSTPAATAGQPVIEPTIDWGKCPQLAPTEEQRKQKTEIIKACLEKHPLTQAPEQLNAEIVDAHRIKLGECALTKEDWFNADKTYKYDKAEAELRKKDVESGLKDQIMDQHKKCQAQALEKFPTTANVIEQVQFYQSCMDFHVSQICSVKIMFPGQ